jgi:putative transposase
LFGRFNLASAAGRSYLTRVLLEPLTSTSWAWQLHYYLCFRTRRRRRHFNAPAHVDLLSATLSEICERHDYHLLRAKVYPDHLRCLLSLRPAQSISTVIQKLKANSARLCGPALSVMPPLWERGHLARSVGRVRLAAVKQYLERQAAHHGYAQRRLPPVFQYRAEQPSVLTAAHASFELNHHLVLATRYRKGVFDSALGQALSRYWLRVASKRGFAIDRISVVPDHIHLVVRTAPKMSIEECALSLLNNGQYFVGRHAGAALVRAGIESLWQATAYAGTTGEVTTALVKKFLSE